MRVFIAVLVLIFSLQSWTKADDISDFEIEGMSIGVSLLDYFSEEEILNKEKIFFKKSKKYYRIAFNLNNSDLYEAIAFFIKDNDKGYIIYGLEGFKEEDYNSCKKKQKKIAKEFREFFSNYREKSYEETHNRDSDSIFYSFDFIFKDESATRIICTDWSKKMENIFYYDNLAVYLYNADFRKWLNTKAY